MPNALYYGDNLEVLKLLQKSYSGKVKLIYRDFPLDQTAVKAARLAECSGKDRYYAVVDMIFATQGTWAAASDPIAVVLTTGSS